MLTKFPGCATGELAGIKVKPSVQCIGCSHVAVVPLVVKDIFAWVQSILIGNRHYFLNLLW